MVHRRLQEYLLRVHGSIEDLYKTRATEIPVTVGTSEARQTHKGPNVTKGMRIAVKTARIPVTVGTLPKVTTVKRMEALRRQKRRQV